MKKFEVRREETPDEDGIRWVGITDDEKGKPTKFWWAGNYRGTEAHLQQFFNQRFGEVCEKRGIREIAWRVGPAINFHASDHTQNIRLLTENDVFGLYVEAEFRSGFNFFSLLD